MADTVLIFIAALIGSVVTQSAIEVWAFRSRVKAHESEVNDYKTQIAGLQTVYLDEKKKVQDFYDVAVSQNEYIKRIEQDNANFKHSFSNTFLNKN